MTYHYSTVSSLPRVSVNLLSHYTQYSEKPSVYMIQIQLFFIVNP